MADSERAHRYRFGVFEADAATGELRRRGIRVKLNGQPFQLLLILLGRPGELVTREEISRELWGNDTFVDFEHGVNSAVNRIREALGDSAANPRFIETLARRGYRFIAPVQTVESGSASPSDPQALSRSDAIEAGGASSAVAEAEPAGEAAPGESFGQPAGQAFSGILTTPADLPKASYPVVLALFVLLQLMYLGFYIGALANLGEIEELLVPLPRAAEVLMVVIVSAAILIPVRAFVLCAILFRAPGFRSKFLKLWGLILVADVLWSLSPFLLLHHINFGVALACTALLVYSPFVQRSLVLMGAGSQEQNFG